MKKHFALALFVLCTGFACPQGEDFLATYKFTTLTPPSNLMSVGSILAITEDGDEDVLETSKLKLVCGPRASLGEEFIAMSSTTVNQQFRQRLQNKWRLDASALDRIKVGAKTEDVESISVQIVNARIVQLSDADVLENLQYRSVPCREAVAKRLAEGFLLTMVSSALLADMQYTVEWRHDKRIDKRSRLQQMQQVAVSLGGGQSRVGLKTIDSRNLALGIKTDAFLLALSMPGTDKQHKNILDAAEREHRPSTSRATADIRPDAPLVLAPGGYIQPEYDPEEE